MEAANIFDILLKYGNKGVDEIKQALASAGRNASMKTSDSVISQVFNEDKAIVLEITALKHIFALEFDRKPTVNTEPGNPTLKQLIRQWIDDKGIEPKDDISKDSLAYLISRKIHREGYKGTLGLLSNIINEPFIEEIEEKIAEEYSVYYVDVISKLLNGTNGNKTT